MELTPEKKLEDILDNYFKENQGKAFTIVALRKRLEIHKTSKLTL